jgi:hypothetical protein
MPDRQPVNLTPTHVACERGSQDHPVDGTPAKKPGYAREWSSPMSAFPASGQPPTVIFCVQGTTRAADRTPQQRLGM